jgi:kynureninase
MASLDLKRHFSRFLGDKPGLHFTAHSHHPWPDVSRDAQLLAWDTAAQFIDRKWETVLGPVMQAVQSHIARQLVLPDPGSIVFAPNTHELVVRLLSCFPANRAIRILTSDSEFHSFGRQIARMEEEGLVRVQRVATEPFESFPERFAEAALIGHDLVFVSQVFFNSGFALDNFDQIMAAAGEAMLVVDGYHGFMARPLDWSPYAARAFYMAGGYKYAMAGEGAAFMHCPPGWGLRPRDTGWYASFGTLNAGDSGVGYTADGWRFMGATFDPSGLFRFRAVQDWLQAEGLMVAMIHDHVRSLQHRLIAGLPKGPLAAKDLLLPAQLPHGNFLSFDLDHAEGVRQRLFGAGVTTDFRGRRLRIGFGICHTEADVDALLARLQDL